LKGWDQRSGIRVQEPEIRWKLGEWAWFAFARGWGERAGAGGDFMDSERDSTLIQVCAEEG